MKRTILRENNFANKVRADMQETKVDFDLASMDNVLDASDNLQPHVSLPMYAAAKEHEINQANAEEVFDELSKRNVVASKKDDERACGHDRDTLETTPKNMYTKHYLESRGIHKSTRVLAESADDEVEYDAEGDDENKGVEKKRTEHDEKRDRDVWSCIMSRLFGDYKGTKSNPTWLRNVCAGEKAVTIRRRLNYIIKFDPKFRYSKSEAVVDDFYHDQSYVRGSGDTGSAYNILIGLPTDNYELAKDVCDFFDVKCELITEDHGHAGALLAAQGFHWGAFIQMSEKQGTEFPFEKKWQRAHNVELVWNGEYDGDPKFNKKLYNPVKH